MLRVMYKNAQFPNILATMARIRYLIVFERGVSKEHRVCVCVSFTRSQPNWTLTGDSGAEPETAFSTTTNKTLNYGISHEKMCAYLQLRSRHLSNLGALKLFWRLRLGQHPIKTLYVGVSFILVVTCMSFQENIGHTFCPSWLWEDIWIHRRWW
jgi:hypothetical protein